MNGRAAASVDNDYYITNFQTIGQFVVTTYADLLTADELQWYAAVCDAPDHARRLYIRLLTRRGSLFRLGRLRYQEIADIPQAATLLERQNLACCAPPVDLGAVVATFTKPELIRLLSLQPLRSMSRVDLVSYLLDSSSSQVNRYCATLCKADQWISLKGHKHWMLMQLCFFGNLYQNSSELVMQQLGTLTYETYPIDTQSRAFATREQIEAHWRYFECEALFDCCDNSDPEVLQVLADQLPCWCASDRTLLRRLDRIRSRIARQLERLGCLQAAMQLYEKTVHPPARERRARILLTGERPDDALLIAQSMVDEPYNQKERAIGCRLLMQCRKALGLSYRKSSIFKPVVSRLVLHDSGMRVEEQARRFYARKGICFHSENSLISAMLGLFIWDIIYHPIAGVFFNPFQAAPADFYYPEFYHKRQTLIDDRFEELNDRVAFGARVLSAYELHFGKVNPLVRWQRLPIELIELAIDRVPLAHWRALFNRLLADLRENTTGLPDLVLFPETQGYEFIEIKGPGDALQAHQRQWMKYFDSHNIAYRLVQVRYRFSNTINHDLKAT